VVDLGGIASLPERTIADVAEGTIFHDLAHVGVKCIAMGGSMDAGMGGMKAW